MHFGAAAAHEPAAHVPLAQCTAIAVMVGALRLMRRHADMRSR
jgi:hypothetical protein